jgi:predicted AlkP superfamily phosphohydrolase/phosphomutase
MTLNAPQTAHLESSGRPRGMRCALGLLLTVALASWSFAASALGASNPAQEGAVIVLGFDGADARTVQELMDRGELPNLAALRDSGSYAPLGSSAPAESPVAWACLNTGQNPAKTGVPTFFMRKLTPKGPQATFGHLVSEMDGAEAPLARFDAPLPDWSAKRCALVAGVIVFLGFALLLRGLLRMRNLPSLALALALGGAAAAAAHKLRGYLPESYPRYGNPLEVDQFWDHAARAGVRSVVLDAAQAFDRPAVEGARVLWGLGVPDARGGNGDWTIYSSDPVAVAPPEGRSTGTAGTVYRVDARGDEVHSTLYGPVNFWRVQKLEAELQAIDRKQSSASLTIPQSAKLDDRYAEVERELRELRYGIPLELHARRDPQDPAAAFVRLGGHEQRVPIGGWSPEFYRLEFALNPLVSVHALTRVKLVRWQGDDFNLFVNVLDIDPSAQPFWQTVGTPTKFPSELASHCGPFETYGWACATMPFKDKEITPETFMEDIEFTLAWRERLTYDVLQRREGRILMSVLSETDRVQHMMYQFYDPQHPLHDPAAAERTMQFCGETIRLRDAIPAIYRQVDRIVGKVLREYVQPADTLILCSDHGFQSFRSQVHVNNWLLEHGYLALREGIELSRGNSGMLSSYVDWSRTRVYSQGLGFLYANVRGREHEGIVEPEQVPALLAELERDWLAARDPANGAPLCSAFYVPSEMHQGAFLDREADAILGFAAPYHVSWATGLGGLALQSDASGKLVRGESGSAVPAHWIEDNRNNWSGDHTSMDLGLVQGIFFSNRRFELPPTGPDLLHVAPTVLKLVGVPIPPEFDRAPLATRP